MKKLIISSLLAAGGATSGFGQADVIDLFYGVQAAPGSSLLFDIDGSTLLDDGVATGAFGWVANTNIDLGAFTPDMLDNFNEIDSSDDFIVPGLFSVIETIPTTELDGSTNLPFVNNPDVTFLFVVYSGPSLAEAEGLFVATDSSFPTFPLGVEVPVADAPDADFQPGSFDNVLLGGIVPNGVFDPTGAGLEGVGYSLALEIPEPGTYAAIFGVIALGLGIARRRLRK
ncbi:MAG: PEP-CTERM sorting domain-containing protein [Opitutales bacterium]